MIYARAPGGSGGPFGGRADAREEVQSRRHGDREAFAGHWPNHLPALLSFTVALSALTAVSAYAQMLDGSVATASDFGARKIFLMLFLMIGPIKILVPFVEITRGADRAFRRALARRAILFSAAALALAGVLGRSMLENFEISLPVLALTGRRGIPARLRAAGFEFEHADLPHALERIFPKK